MTKYNPLKNIPWPDLQSLPPKEKGRHFNSANQPYHVLTAQQFNRPMLEQLGLIATQARRIGKTKAGLYFLKDLLGHKRSMLYFVQPSTRTFLSFYAACEILGIQCADVRDTTTSSEIKGESPEDTVRTFSSFFDLIIMRHPVGGFAERIAWLLSQTERPVPLINAGSGKDQHPTQALLDIYTLQRSFENRGGIDGKHIAFVGDLARGRTVRSLAALLTLYRDVKQYFIAPPSLQIGPDIIAELDKAGCSYEISDNFEKIVPQVDAIYMTRIQDEWDNKEESRLINTTPYHFTAAHLDRLKPDAVLLHPLPRRAEIAPEVDNDPRAVYWRQVRNGMWIRVALLIAIFGRGQEVDQAYQHFVTEK